MTTNKIPKLLKSTNNVKISNQNKTSTKMKDKRNEYLTEAPICCGKFMKLCSGRQGTCYFQCNKCGGCRVQDI